MKTMKRRFLWLAAVALAGAVVIGCPSANSSGSAGPGEGEGEGDNGLGFSSDGSEPGDAATVAEDWGATPKPDSSAPQLDGQGPEIVGADCTPGETTGCQGLDAVMTCNAMGTGFLPVMCPPGTACKDGACTNPMKCEPGQWYCEGLAGKKQCLQDGSGFGAAVLCPENQYCSSGECGISCDLDVKFGSYVGCEFWTVDLPNYPDPFVNPTPEDLPHAVMVSNPFEMDAKVEFIGPPGTYPAEYDPIVPAQSSMIYEMPSTNVDECTISKSGVKVKSNRPVLVHQFNPWDNSFSNDASLLLPEPLLGEEYVVMSYATSPIGMMQFPGLPPAENQYGYFTVLAPFDDTHVTVSVTASTKPPGKDAADPELGMPKGATKTFTLQSGEVLNLQAEPQSLFDLADLTGSRVFSDKPVAVFGGHEEMVLGEAIDPDPEGGDTGACCADHLEEQMLPLALLDNEYLAVKTRPRGTPSEPELWRIQAAEPNVTVTIEPPQPDQNGKMVSSKTLTQMGNWLDVYTSESFEIKGTGKLQVGQYMVSQGATMDFTGDPSLILAIPTERYRSFYALTAPPDYSENYITIIKEAAAVVKVDGVPVAESEFKAVGSAGWVYAYVEISVGIHTAESGSKFGLVAYGFNNAVSYGYPGGLSIPGE